MPSDTRSPPGFWRQIRIILWKNTILYYRNLSGLICELLMTSVFIASLILLIKITASEQNTTTDDRLSYPPETRIIDQIDQDSYLRSGYIYYYPESPLTDRLIQDTFITLKGVKNNLMGVRGTSMPLSSLNLTSMEDEFTFVVFPEVMRNATVWPELIEYKIYLTVI